MSKTLKLSQLGLGELASPLLRTRMDELFTMKTQYYHAKEKSTKRAHFLEIYSDLNRDNFESAMSLAFYFFEYAQKEGKKPETLPNVLFDNLNGKLAGNIGSPFQTKKSVCLSALVELEAFVKYVGHLLWGNIRYNNKNSFDDKISNARYFELTSREAGSSFVEFPSNNGRTTITDVNNEIFRNLTSTLRSYRNHNVHIDFRDGEELSDVFDLVNNEDWVFATISYFIILTIWYHYDAIYDIVVPADIKEGKSQILQTKADPYQLINDTYIPAIKKQQETAVDHVYDFVAHDKSTAEDRQHIINVRISSVQLDEEGALDHSAENQEEAETSPTDIIYDLQYDKVLLVGDAGTGKSTIVSQLMKKSIENWQKEGEDSVHKLPIRIDLKMLNNKVNIDFGTVLKSEISRFFVDNDVKQAAVSSYVDDALRNGSAIVFLDGLDEIAPDTKQHVIDRLLNGIKEYPCQYVVTSRLTGMGRWLIKFNDFLVYKLCSLKDDLISQQIKFSSIVSEGRENAYEKEKYLKSVIEENKMIRQMAENPMQLMMIVHLLQESPDYQNIHFKGKVIRNRSALYNEFVQSKVNREKEKFESLNEDFADDLERVLAFVAHALIETQSYPKIKDRFAQGTHLGGNSERLVTFLEKANTMGLIDFNGDNIKFVHNNWHDYFYALKYIKDILYDIDDDECLRNTIDAIVAQAVPSSKSDASKEEQEEEIARKTQLLQNVFELMELNVRGSKQKQDLCDRLLCELAVKYLRAYQNSQSSKPYPISIQKSDETADAYHIEANNIPVPNKGLEPLAKATAMLEKKRLAYDEADNRRFFRPHPRILTEMMLMNQLILYKRFHADGEINMDLLQTLFRAVAMSGSHRLTDELFEPYWLRMWLLWEGDVKEISKTDYAPIAIKVSDIRKCKSKLKYFTRKLTLELLYNHSDADYLLDKLLDMYKVLYWLKMKSLSNTESAIIRILSKMNDRRLKLFWSNLQKQEVSFTNMLFMNSALLLMKDVEFCLEHYDFTLKCNLPKYIIENLLERIDEPDVPKLLLRVCKDTLINYPEQRADILQYMIQDGTAFNELKEWLKDESLNILTQQRGLANMLLLSQVPQWYVNRYYDLDIYQYLCDNSQDLTTDLDELRERIRSKTRKTSWRRAVVDEPNQNGDIHRTQVDAVLLGIHNTGHISVVSERIQTSISGCFAKYGNKKHDFVVESNVPGTGSFVEMTLLGGNQVIPLWGKLELPFYIDEEGAVNSVKYVYSMHSDNFFTIRICDTDSILWLQDKETQNRLLNNCRVMVSHVSMYILNIQEYNYSPTTSIIKLRVANPYLKIGNSSENCFLPEPTGLLSFNRTIGNGRLPLKIDDTGRRPITSIDNAISDSNSTSEATCSEVPLVYEQPVCNDNYLKGEKKNPRNFATRQVKYSYYSDLGIMKLPEPLTVLSGLYYRINDEGESILLSADHIQLTQDSKTGFKILEVKVGEKLAISREGFVCFYADRNCSLPVNIEFSNILSLVQLADYSKYHSSLCDVLIDECKYGHYGSPALYSFFYKLGNSVKYVELYDSLTDKEREKHGTITPEIYVVTYLSHTFVHLLSSTKLIEEEIFASKAEIGKDKKRVGLPISKKVTADEPYHKKREHFEKGDLVVREENGALRKVLLTNQLREYGFIDGIVIEIKNNHDAYIKTGIFRCDFYYTIKPGETLGVGDVVRFYPSVNYSFKNNQKPIVTNMKFLRHGIYEGLVSSIKRDNDGEGWIFEIQNAGHTATKISAYVKDKLYLAYVDFFKQLEIGSTVSYYLDCPYLKKRNNENRAYIVLPNSQKS